LVGAYIDSANTQGADLTGANLYPPPTSFWQNQSPTYGSTDDYGSDDGDIYDDDYGDVYDDDYGDVYDDDYGDDYESCVGDCNDMDNDGRTWDDIDGDGDGRYESP
jgi:hypothetical protein